MAEPFRMPWPMWRCHYFLLGGNRRMAPVLAVTIFGLTFGFLGFRRLMHAEPLAWVAGTAAAVLGAAQGALLVFGGCNAVYRAMLRDYDTRMIESHRLSPMTNTSVVLGYLFGPTIQMVALSVVVLVFGSVFSWLASGTVGNWLVGNAVLFAGTVSLWAVVVFSGMRQGKPISPAAPMIGLGVFANAGLIMIPGVGIMISAYSVTFAMLSMWGLGGRLSPSAGAVLIVLQTIITGYWIAAAAAKYRRPDLPALNAVRGGALLLMWLIFGALGIVAFGMMASQPQWSSGLRGAEDVQWSVTLILSLLMALIPLNGAVQCRLLASRGASLRGWSDRVPDWLVAVLAALLICAVMSALGVSVWAPILSAQYRRKPGVPVEVDPALLAGYVRNAWLMTTVACVLALTTARSVMVFFYALTSSPRLIVSMLLVILWVLPPLADTILTGILHEDPEETVTLSALFGCSPIGTIVLTWHDLPGVPIPGLVVQAVIAVLATLLALRVRGRLASRSGKYLSTASAMSV